MISTNGIAVERCVHFDFGNELRAIAAGEERNPVFSDDEVGFIQGVLEEGLLLENEKFYLAKKILTDFTKRHDVGRREIIILNGLPRHVGQAEDMTDMVTVKSVVELKCSDGDVLCRIREDTGGDRSQRVDDDNALVKKKIETYNKRTRPLVDFYTTRGAALIEVVVTPDSDTCTLYNQFMNIYRSLQLKAQ
jgi:adenylate kinase